MSSSPTGGPEFETRCDGIADRVEVQRLADGGSRYPLRRRPGGVSAPQLGRVRELAMLLGATMHTVVGDDVPTALLTSPREMNATQLVVGTSGDRDGHACLTRGIGARTVQESGGIDVHMVTHPAASRASPGGRGSPARAAYRVVAGRAGGALGDLRHHGGLARPGFMLPAALFFIGVLIVALLGAVSPPPHCR